MAANVTVPAEGPLASATGPVTTSYSNEPLTPGERQQAMTYLMQEMGLSEEYANKLLNNMQPSEVREFMGIVTGQDNITREEAKTCGGLAMKNLTCLQMVQNT
ncbi:MAG: hypothetical protein HC848_05320 [Limnobacter sp.]|nr:hypothetical protein [Limnobacter sp.]